MAQAATLDGNVICFRCRTAVGGSCRCSMAAEEETGARYSVTTSMLGLWLAGAALADPAVQLSTASRVAIKANPRIRKGMTGKR